MKIKAGMKEELRKFLLKKTREEEEKAVITSAHKLSEEEVSALKKTIPSLQGSSISVVVDESLLAGVIIKKGSRIIDLSLQGKLSELQDISYESA